MRKIAVINQKGGVGKTTTTVNLAAALASMGRRVLLIDLDPQAHLTMHFGHEVQERDPTVYEVLTDRTPLADVVRSVRDRVALAPAHTDLAGAETELVNTVGREVILREAIEPVSGDHDLMMIDCPPSLSVLTINALAAADEVLIPLQTHFLGLQGLGKLLETMTLVRRRINPRLVVSGIVLCMYDTGTRLAGEVVDDLRGFLEGCRGRNHVCAEARLFHTKVRRNIKLAEAPSFGQTIFDYAPQSNGAVDYLSLAAEVMLDDQAALGDSAGVLEAGVHDDSIAAPPVDPAVGDQADMKAAATQAVGAEKTVEASPAADEVNVAAEPVVVEKKRGKTTASAPKSPTGTPDHPPPGGAKTGAAEPPPGSGNGRSDHDAAARPAKPAAAADTARAS